MPTEPPIELDPSALPPLGYNKPSHMTIKEVFLTLFQLDAGEYDTIKKAIDYETQLHGDTIAKTIVDASHVEGASGHLTIKEAILGTLIEGVSADTIKNVYVANNGASGDTIAKALASLMEHPEIDGSGKLNPNLNPVVGQDPGD